MAKPPSLEQWIAWVAATAVAAVSMAAYAFSTFETTNHATETKTDIVKRLDQIESKLDQALARLPRR